MSLNARASIEERAIEPELVRLLYGSSVPSVTSVAVALATCVLLWPYVPQPMVLGWGTLIGIVHGLRLWLQHAIFSEVSDPSAAARWLKIYAWTALPIGLALAALALPISQGLGGNP